MESTNLFSEICNIVKKAGQIIRPLSSSTVTDIQAKTGSANFVTKYDSMVQSFLIRELSSLVPEASFIGEEDGYSAQTVSNGLTFIIDPIDGTTNFICNFMLSTICVGLADHGEMVIGVVYNPFRDELFAAQKGVGAFLNGIPLHMADLALGEGILCADTAPYTPELRDEIFDKLKKLSYHCMDIRSIGSAAASICYIACGRSVAALSPRLCVWDYAAASLVLKEAGGIILDMEGKDPALSTKIGIMAGTPKAVQDIRNILNG